MINMIPDVNIQGWFSSKAWLRNTQRETVLIYILLYTIWFSFFQDGLRAFFKDIARAFSSTLG